MANRFFLPFSFAVLLLNSINISVFSVVTSDFTCFHRFPRSLSLQAIEDTDNAKKYQFLSEILRWRANTTPDHVIYTLMNSKGQEALKVGEFN